MTLSAAGTESVLTMRRLVDEHLLAHEDITESSGDVPPAVIQALQTNGAFGLSIPIEYGGAGLALAEEVEAVRELGRASAAFRSLVGINLGVGSQAIQRFGDEAQRREWLPQMASGEVIASFALTEDTAGSDAMAVRTSAVHTPEGWRLDGRKRFVTNAPHATVATVIAVTDPERRAERKHLSAFIVPLSSEGVTVHERHRLLGQRGGYWADVTFDGVLLPSSSLIGTRGGGVTVMRALLDRSRIHVAALAAGQAQRLITEMLDHATRRFQFGKELASQQLVQAMIADSYAEAYAIDTQVRDAAAQYDDGQDVSVRAAAVKMFATESVGRIADRAVQILGATGLTSGHPVERIYRDVRLLRFIEGTTQMQQINIARGLLREHRDRRANHAV